MKYYIFHNKWLFPQTKGNFFFRLIQRFQWDLQSALFMIDTTKSRFQKSSVIVDLTYFAVLFCREINLCFREKPLNFFLSFRKSTDGLFRVLSLCTTLSSLLKIFGISTQKYVLIYTVKHVKSLKKTTFLSDEMNGSENYVNIAIWKFFKNMINIRNLTLPRVTTHEKNFNNNDV